MKFSRIRPCLLLMTELKGVTTAQCGGLCLPDYDMCRTLIPGGIRRLGTALGGLADRITPINRHCVQSDLAPIASYSLCLFRNVGNNTKPPRYFLG